jgi:hypothetical protein
MGRRRVGGTGPPREHAAGPDYASAEESVSEFTYELYGSFLKNRTLFGEFSEVNVRQKPTHDVPVSHDREHRFDVGL